MILPRRKFLIGLGSLIAAPAVVRVENLMPVRSVKLLSPQEIYTLWANMAAQCMQQNIYETVMYGSSFNKNNGGLITFISAKDIYALHSRY